MPKNKRNRIIIIGGVAGGATAAARLRRLDENSEIIVFEKGKYVSFANCGLPYYIGGVIENKESLLVQTEEGIEKRYNIDIRTRTEVIKIDREKKLVIAKDLQNGEEVEEPYDNLVLSPGAKPIKPPINGIDEADNVFTLRNIADSDQIKEYVKNASPKNAVVIGGGFIGVEMAENLANLGLKVSIVEKDKQLMNHLDFEMAAIINNHLADRGIEIVVNDGVSSFKSNGKKVVLESGKTIDSDISILSIGIKPESSLAKQAGLKVNEKGSIIVNDLLQTSDKSIYAVGDVIEIKHFISRSPMMIPLAWPANRQGRIAADNIYGKEIKYTGTLGTAVVKVFDLTAASTGLSEKELQDTSQEYQVIHLHPNCHASYYPGAYPIDLKVLFDRTGKILGAQGVGHKGVDKRIDVIATAIKGDLTIEDLADLELGYSPEYSSAKDPVNMAGYIGTNVLNGDVDTIQWHEVEDRMKKGSMFLDVREPEELVLGHIKEAKNISLNDLRSRLSELPKNKEIIVYCAAGLRGYLAALILKHNGFNAMNLDGGWKTYQAVHPNDSTIKYKGSMQIEDTGLSKQAKTSNIKADIEVDCVGMQCPGPITSLYNNVKKAKSGQIIKLSATDIGFKNDVESWSKKTGNILVDLQADGNKIVAYVQKGDKAFEKTDSGNFKDSNKVTLIAFSGELDKALATFIIANGATSFGKEVHIFFTFWGLNILRKDQKVKVDKTVIEKAFGGMMPRGSKDLPISKMNMMGMGSTMIKTIMKQKNVDSLDTMIEQAKAAGVKLLACSMSMDIMGIKREELIDGIEVCGVGTYLAEAQDSGVTLFI